MNNMFNQCFELETIPQLDTSNVSNVANIFNYCRKIVNIPELDGSKITNLTSAFAECYGLKNFDGFKNLGQAYSTTAGAGNSAYTLDLHYSSNLSHDSLIKIMNNLYDIKNKGCNPQKLYFGSIILNKLSDEEKAIATSKRLDIKLERSKK